MAKYKHALDEVLSYDILNRPLYRGSFILFPSGNTLALGVVKGKPSIADFKGVFATRLIGLYGSGNTSVLSSVIYRVAPDEAVSLLTKAKLEDYHCVRHEGLQYLESVERQRMAEEAKRNIEEAKRATKEEERDGV